MIIVVKVSRVGVDGGWVGWGGGIFFLLSIGSNKKSDWGLCFANIFAA